MSEERIDKQMKDSLGNLHREPTDRVWAGIEKALDSMPVKNAKKRGAFWYYSAAAVFVGLLAFIYLQTCNDNQTSSHSALAQSSVSTSENNTANTSNSETSNQNLPQNSTNSSDEISVDISTKTTSVVDKIYSKTNKNTIPIKKQSYISFDSKQIVSNNTLQENSTEIPVTSGNYQTDKELVSSDITAKTEAESKIPEPAKVESESIEIKPEFSPSLNSASQNAVFQAEEIQTESNANSPNSTMGIRRATNLSFDVFGGGVYTLSNKKTNLDFESSSIISKPISNIVTPQLGLNAKYTVNNWYITAGLGYSAIGENINYTINRTGVDTSGSYANPVLSGLLYDTNGYYDDPLYPGVAFPILVNPHFDTLGFNWITVKENYSYSDKVKSANRYKYIDIPVTLGYIWDFKRIQLDVSAGASFAIRLGVQGNSVNNNEVTSFSENNNPYKKVITTALLGVGVAYQYDSRTKVFFRPTYRINMGSVFENSDNSGVKYNSFALNAGLNYSINR